MNTSTTPNRIVIVGNCTKPTSKDYSKFIDESDIVVRFNAMQTYGQHGTKTTHTVFRAGKQFWGWNEKSLTLNNKNFQIKKGSKTRFIILNQRDTTDLSKKLQTKYGVPFESWKPRVNRYVYFRANHIYEPKPIPKGITRRMFSSGYVMLNYFLKNPEYKNYDVHLVGFSWRGHFVHDWKWEREQCQKLEAKNKLRILK